ncbi:MAG: T9SS type A sorting domain-containing protein [Fibrobacterota bacterium]
MTNTDMQGFWGRGAFGAYNTVCRYGLVAVDANKIFASITTKHATVTFDGGLTWKNITGTTSAKSQIWAETIPTALTTYPFISTKSYTMNTQNVVYHHSYVNNDILCGGFFKCDDNRASPIWYRKVKYNGSTWDLQPHYMVDDSASKCQPASATELPSGQLWQIWYHGGFFWGQGMHAKYSNDSGQTWQAVDNKRVIGFYGNNYGPYFPVPYKNGVAVIWAGKETSYASSGKLGWAYSLPDSSGVPQTWSTFSVISAGYSANCVAVMGANYDSIFVAMVGAGNVKVAALINDTWIIEDVGTTAIVAYHSPNTAIKGDTYLDGIWGTDLNGRAAVTICEGSVYCLWADSSGGQYRIFLKKRLGDNNWSVADTLVTQSERFYQMGVPAKCPAGRIPLMWDYSNDAAGAHQGGVRFLNYDLVTGLNISYTPVAARPPLLKAVPNPFNPSTTLQIDSRIKKGGASLKIFSASGKLVADLSAGVGNSRVVWNAANQPSGVYIVTLKSDHFNYSQRITLMK